VSALAGQILERSISLVLSKGSARTRLLALERPNATETTRIKDRSRSADLSRTCRTELGQERVSDD